jgi:hypothetical protein
MDACVLWPLPPHSAPAARVGCSWAARWFAPLVCRKESPFVRCSFNVWLTIPLERMTTCCEVVQKLHNARCVSHSTVCWHDLSHAGTWP